MNHEKMKSLLEEQAIHLSENAKMATGGDLVELTRALIQTCDAIMRIEDSEANVYPTPY
nr:MAG TPA: hypothetical protein [Caudoviricetes sp.]